ncbi:hypothetical protein [Chitinophaga sp. 212800010-3]|uniref:hypothetical protein n=1 Tax=unclassified Chitinophaga TaxID=2619133 RepID=UPI002DE3BE2F|nr:Transcriptional regulator [Chitinophaga sp. 212800010-3]
MTTDAQALQIIAKLSNATDYEQADQILQEIKQQQPGAYKSIFTSLGKKIEDLSPLECNSLQWSMYRYTLMNIRKCSSMETAS